MIGAGPEMRQRGFALLIVLWTLALLALLGTKLVVTGHSDAQLARNLMDADVLEAATNGAIQQAIFEMLEPPGRRWIADGTVHLIRLGLVDITVRLEDESGKVNPNIASRALLAALLVQVGASPEAAVSLAAAIIDWRTGSGQQSLRDVTTARYALAGRDYGPLGEDFRDIDELSLVMGMTPELLARLRPHITVYSESDPDGSTRDPLVAAALRESWTASVSGHGSRPIVTIVTQSKDGRKTAFAKRVVVEVDPTNTHRPYEILDESGKNLGRP